VAASLWAGLPAAIGLFPQVCVGLDPSSLFSCCVSERRGGKEKGKECAHVCAAAAGVCDECEGVGASVPQPQGQERAAHHSRLLQQRTVREHLHPLPIRFS
jgi:hypothetical protein